MRHFRAKCVQSHTGAGRKFKAFDSTAIMAGLADDLREFALVAARERIRLGNPEGWAKHQRKCEAPRSWHECHSAVICAALITPAHFATSAGSMAATAAGVVSATGMPCLARFVRTQSLVSAASTA